MYVEIFYDGDCPFCQKYISLLRLKKTVTTARVFNLRDNKDARETLAEKGLNPDQGMLVIFDGRYFYGADAMNTLALLSTPSNVANRINARVLSNPIMASALYPLFRSFRWLVLLFLGHSTITKDNQSSVAKQTLFAILFSLFSLFHFFNYSFEYRRFPPELDQFFILVSAAFLLFNPKSSRLLFILVVASSISTVLQAPVDSNHTMVRTAWLLGYWFSFVYSLVRAAPYVEAFTGSVVAGQGTLLVMYFFGVFHKINTGFLNPATSCAVALWQRMPAPLSYIDYDWVPYAAIYGTFLLEGLLIAALITTRYRHLGITFGILFHLLLALSGYAMYISFTMLAITLHCLFLNGDAAQRILNSQEVRSIRRISRQNRLLVTAFGCVLLVGVATLAYLRIYTQVALLSFLAIVPLCYLIIKYGKSLHPQQASRAAKIIGVGVTILFFINCSLPYFGLKSAQTINMFANIRLEGGVNNHLVRPSTEYRFGYLDDIVTITSIQGGKNPGLVSDGSHAEVYYDMLAALDNNPLLEISYIRDGETFQNQSKADLQGEIDSILHHRWVRKWFHFKPVPLASPERCTI